MHWRRRRNRRSKQSKSKSNKTLCISILKLWRNLRPHKKKISWAPPCKKKRDCARVVGKKYWKLKIHRRRRIRIRRFAKQRWRRRRRRLQRKKKKNPQQIVADPCLLWTQSEWGVLLVFLFLFFWGVVSLCFCLFCFGSGFPSLER